MTDQVEQPTTEDPQPNTPTDEPVAADNQSDSGLEDAGKKAIAAERRARAAAEKQAKQLKDRLDAIEAEKLSDQEKAVKAAHAAGLPKTVLTAIDKAPKYAEGRGVRFEVRTKKDLEGIRELAAIKMSN